MGWLLSSCGVGIGGKKTLPQVPGPLQEAASRELVDKYRDNEALFLLLEFLPRVQVA
jgi:hypothetical protein